MDSESLKVGLMLLGATAQLVAIGIAFGGLRAMVHSLREITEALNKRVELVERRVDDVEDRMSRQETVCKLSRHSHQAP